MAVQLHGFVFDPERLRTAWGLGLGLWLGRGAETAGLGEREGIGDTLGCERFMTGAGADDTPGLGLRYSARGAGVKEGTGVGFA